MNRIRDFIYNISDILVTLIIIAAALILISWRVTAIMDYGSKGDSADDQAAQGQIVAHDDLIQPASNDASTDAAINGEAPADAAPDANAGTDSSQVITFTLNDSGSSEEVAAQLAAAGIITDTKTFLSAANAAGADTKLRNGTFEIPVGSTPEDIVNILIG